MSATPEKTSTYPNSGYSAGAAETLDLGEFLHLLHQHRGKILLCVALAVGAALCYLHYAAPVYQSRALLEVEQDPQAVANGTDSSDILRTMEVKLDSDPVLLGVIKANHLDTDPDFLAPEPALTRLAHRIHGGAVEMEVAPGQPVPQAVLLRRLQDKISVDGVRGSLLISVTAEDHDPVKARQLAASVINQFFQQAWDSEHADAVYQRKLLLAEAQRVGAESLAAEAQLQAYRERYHAVSLEEKQDIVVERLRDLNTQVSAAHNTRLAMESDAQQIHRLGDADPQQLLNIKDIAAAPEVIDLRKAVTLQQAQIATLSKRYGPLHPTMIQARSELTALQGSLDRAIRKAAALVLQSYASAQATEAALEAALAQQEKAALELDRIAIPYHSLEQQVEADSTTYQKILDKLRQSEVDHGLITRSDVDGTNIQLVQPPLVPARPARPAPRLWLALSVAAGLFVGCGSALVARALDNTVSSVDGAETFLGLPVLISVPRARHRRRDAGPAVVVRPASPEAEAFRTLRTSLSLLPTAEKDRGAVLFISAVPGEGKSYCSLNYAAALAQQGLRTLLIDGDLRRPTIMQCLSLTGPKNALTDCLRRPELFAEAVRPTPVEKLFVLADMEGRPGGAELLAQDAMSRILERAAGEFDRVVLDSAPLIAVSDTLHIAKHVSTICLVVHAGRTPRRLVRRACSMLKDVAGRTPTGVVLNQTPRGQSASYDYYYSSKAYA